MEKQEKQPKKNRRAYLDNYAKSMDGTYIYTGRYMKFTGTPEQKKSLDKWLIISNILLVILLIASAFTLIGLMSVMLYIVIPYVLEIILSFFTVWYSIKLLAGKDPLKEHVHKQVLGKLPAFAVAVTVFSCLGFILCIVFLLVYGSEYIVTLNIIYTIIRIFIAACGVLLYKTVKKYTFELA